eukprot:10816999-Heterocapsa_arctica.AAC.1
MRSCISCPLPSQTRSSRRSATAQETQMMKIGMKTLTSNSKCSPREMIQSASQKTPRQSGRRSMRHSSG